MAEPIRVVRGGVLVPEWGNEDRREEEKIRIHYRFLSFAEQHELIDVADVGKSFAYESRVIAKMIWRIDNLTVIGETDQERPIETGQQLVDEPALDRLAMECWREIRTKTAIEKKG